MEPVDAVATPGITPPAAFRDLRRSLHAAAGAGRIAERRTHETIRELRSRANHLLEAMEVHQGTGLGYWYAELATRLMREADAIERLARKRGVLS